MNKCLQCKNFIMGKNKKIFSCKYFPTIIVYGDIGVEPIKESCGHVELLKEYKNGNERRLMTNGYRA